MKKIVFAFLLLFLSSHLLADTQEQKNISLNFDSIPVRSVLQIFSGFTHANIIISNSVQGTMSLHLNNVPWTDALATILQTQGLAEQRIGDVIIIAPIDEINAQQALVPLSSEIFQIHYGKAADYYANLKDPTSSLLSPRGKAILNARTNKLFVEDTPEKLEKIKEYILSTDLPVRQVDIEARIVNLDTSYEEQIGIQWNLGGSGGSTSGGFSMNFGATPLSGINPATLAIATISKNILIGLELSAIEAEGGGEIISSPHLLTADQQEAIIEQGQEIPYQQATALGATSIAFKQAVLRLKVTPQIMPGNKILLQLEVNQDAKAADTNSGVPLIDTRHLLTNVWVNNGETIVLGGIYERTKTHNVTRVPFLSTLPVLGHLFEQEGVQDQKKELLIFVTPRIVEGKENGRND